MNVQAHVFVSGNVQGVFFRSSTRRKAQSLDVKGWVKNLADGRVEAVFEGKEEAVNEMIQFCRQGPRAADVRDVEVERKEYTGKFDSFSIKY